MRQSVINNPLIGFLPEKKSDRYAIYLIFIFALMHMFVAGRFGLSSDEAHYALYGTFTELSYFDHPPLVGWLQSLILYISDSNFIMRLWPLLISVLTAWSFYKLIGELFPHDSPWLGFLSLLLMQSAVVYHLLAIALVPETPLILFSILTFRSLLRVVNKESMHDWMMVCIWLGLAGLSKYTAVTLVISVILMLITEQRLYLISKTKFWIGVVLAALIVSPVFYWNAVNDWISFEYQIKHGTGASEWRLDNFFTGLAGQLLASGPALFVFGVIGTVAAFTRPINPGARRVLIFSLPVLIVFNWNSGYVPALPHWTSLGWLLLAPLAVRWLMSHWSSSRISRTSIYLSAVVSLILILAIHVQLYRPWIPFPHAQDPFTEFYGWDKVMQKATSLRDKMTGTDDTQGKIFVGSWTLASRLAWYGRPEPIMVTDRRYDQFDIWFGAPVEGDHGIFIQWSVFPFPPSSEFRGEYFNSCKQLESMQVTMNGRVGAEFVFFACEGYRP